MKSLVVAILLVVSIPSLMANDVVATTNRLVDAALASSQTWTVLSYLTDRIGPRLSGSEGAARAVDYTMSKFDEWGIYARKEPVKVPHWVRGAEEAKLVSHGDSPLVVTALGGSVATPDAGITADVVAVRSFDELDALGTKVAGKIVLFQFVMDPKMVDQWRALDAYGASVGARGRGASRAAKYGAVAALVRSVTSRSLRTPHTGALRYDDDQPKIPAGALTTEDADLIERLLAGGDRVRVWLRLTPRTLPDADSFNVIAEIPGSEKPEEIVLLGGHLDSWDLGRGAHDDGAGVAAVMETMRLIHSMGLKPRRTIRAVLFMNEENGLKGGKAYAARYADDMWRHVAAIEHDLGAGAPVGFETSLTPSGIEMLRPWLGALDRLSANALVTSGSTGADTSPLVSGGCVPGFGVIPDATHYFDIHHTAADTLDKVDPEALRKSTAALAALTWALADMPGRVR